MIDQGTVSLPTTEPQANQQTSRQRRPRAAPAQLYPRNWPVRVKCGIVTLAIGLLPMLAATALLGRQVSPVTDETPTRLALAALALCTVLAAALSTFWLTRPIVELARALITVRAGDYSTRVGLAQRDEVGQVSAAVDLLIARTQALVSNLDNQHLDLENGIIQLFTELAEAASGDLTVRPTMSEGSLGAVADSVNILLQRFNATVKGIQTTAGAVSDRTSQMATTVLSVSQEAQRQVAHLDSSAMAIAEMATSALEVSQRTQAATEVAAQAVEAVESGNKAVSYAHEAVRRTGETSKKAARQVKTLGESTQLMGNTLLLVQRNTEELHLIAGNASIEAARYAESGGVFRTVADSIEQLALQSQVALRQIQSVVENTQRETARVVEAIEEVSAEVMHVARAVGRAGENFDTINLVVQRLADLNIFIASASEQQAHMAAEVAGMIGALNQVSAQTAMHTAASAEAAVQLRQLTEQLNDSVSTLKVR
ncbi:MAG TPA: methyl-accepting chemotaxis protein [Chloroflexota bacterium]|nr:methyl-accepting chemotaxis protein [Chloroflexota bacterium]